jgi:hypothetical protein
MNATVVRPSEGAIVTVPLAEPEAASVYSGFERGPKFLAIQEILALRADVDRAQSVTEAKRPVAAALGELELWKCLEGNAAAGTLEFTEPGSPRTVRVEHVALAAGQLRPASGHREFVLTERVSGKPVRSARAEAGTLRAVSEAGFEPRFSLLVPSATQAKDLVSGLPGRWSPRLDDLLPAGCAPRDWSAAPSGDALQAARAFPSKDGIGPLAAIHGTLEARMANLERARRAVIWESDSHVTNRFAQSASIVLVLLLGAALAVALRHAMPLTVYLLAFIPAVANIFMVSGGQLMMAQGLVVAGAAVMWGGNLVLLAVLFATWRRIVRN